MTDHILTAWNVNDARARRSSANMNTQTEILMKRTCERFKIGVDERQRVCLFKVLENERVQKKK